MKTAVVTGASSGIGLVVARTLAGAGWRVVALGRNPQRSAAALAQLQAAAPPGVPTHMVVADLAVLAQADRAAREVAGLVDHIDVLVNNAGGIPANRLVTPDGLEECFAGNHLGPFLLTQRLLPLLKAAGPGAQVINTASVAHKFTKDMKWDDLQLEQGFNPGDAYAQAKLANILFARELARRTAADGIRANAVHPGFVASNFAAHGNALVKAVYWLGNPFALTETQGADTILWLAQGGAPGVTGEYFIKRKVAKTTPAASNAEGAARLWRSSEELLARAGF